MKVVDLNTVEKKDYTEQPLFEGGTVYSQMAFLSDQAKELMVGVITFEPGATTKMHTHDFEQVLYVISGKGKVSTENEEYIVTPGTFVFFPPRIRV